jgi:ribosome-associated protein
MSMPPALTLRPSEVEFSAILSQGAGGQNVNKVHTGVQLRFDIPASSLPEPVKVRLLACGDSRISRDGVFVIKAQGHRSQALNRQDALRRLQERLDSVAQAPKARKPTRRTLASVQRRLEGKKNRSAIKAGRGRVTG